MHQRLSTTFVSGLITLNTRRLRDRNSSSFICSKIAISKSTKDCLEFASTFRLYLSNFFWKSRPNGMATRDQQPSTKQLSIKVVVMKQFSWRVKENYVPQLKQLFFDLNCKNFFEDSFLPIFLICTIISQIIPDRSLN